MKNSNINTNQDYKYGFTTDIENIRAPKGLSEKSIKFISKIKLLGSEQPLILRVKSEQIGNNFRKRMKNWVGLLRNG